MSFKISFFSFLQLCFCILTLFLETSLSDWLTSQDSWFEIRRISFLENHVIFNCRSSFLFFRSSQLFLFFITFFDCLYYMWNAYSVTDVQDWKLNSLPSCMVSAVFLGDFLQSKWFPFLVLSFIMNVSWICSVLVTVQINI